MSKNLLFAVAILTIFAFGSLLGADTTKTVPAPAAPKQLHPQELCPVMGSKINKKFYLDIQGQRVYFCCAGCSDKMKADPDTYFKKAAAAGEVFENIQKICPVSGEKIDKKIYSDWNGRRVYFCCKKCRSLFPSQPDTYIKQLDMPPDSVKWDKSMM
jgi:YHS domain-containing protein